MNTAEEIKERLSIIDLAVRLGCNVNNSLFIKSFDHPDTNPSLRLYPKTNSYYDFSTGKYGDVIKFYQEACRVDFITALNELSDICGIKKVEGFKVRHTVSKPSQIVPPANDIIGCFTEDEKYLYEERLAISGIEKDALHTVTVARLESNMEIFAELYSYCNAKGFNTSALTYLIDERKFPVSLLKRFKLFFIDNYFEVNQHLKKIFPAERLIKSGLFNNKIEDGKTKSNLIFNQHRIVIPYLWKDKIVYLRARYFDSANSAKTNKNKYSGLINDALNLNRTRRFFNIDVLRKMLPGEKLYICEGEFDAMAIESIGFNSICIPGAANIPDNKYFNMLAEYEVILCMDNDAAGSKLKDALIKIFHDMKKDVSLKELPTKDVNDFIVQNA